MTHEEREARLTAYALNDATLSAADRQEIEQQLAGDASLRTEVESIRSLAAMLTTSLQAEQAATPAKEFVTLPQPAVPTRKRSQWRMYAMAAAVLLAVGATGVGVMMQNQPKIFSPVASNAPSSFESRVTGSVRSTSLEQLDGDNEQGLRFQRGGVGDAGRTGDAPLVMAEKPTSAPTRAEIAPSKGAAPAGNPAGEMPTIPLAKQAPFGGSAPAGPSAAGGSLPGAGPSPAGLSPGAGGYPGGSTPGRQTSNMSLRGLPTDAIKNYDPTPGALPASPPQMPALEAKNSRRMDLDVAKLPAGVSDVKQHVAELEKRLESLRRNVNENEVKGGEPSTYPFRHREDVRLLEAEIQRFKNHPSYGENAFVKVLGQDALSTFGIDVDTASYSMVRKYLAMHQMPPAMAVRLEEMVNYFPYQDKAPVGDDPFAVTVEMAECPWNTSHRLARIGLKAKPIDNSKRPPSNLVFLIDVSGSMNGPTRLPLVKASLKMLVNQLGENDRVAMVVYAGTTGLVLDSTSASNKAVILSALDRLEAGGSTNGSGGIQQAYAVATANLIKNGTNRVILCTDGDWNVGTTSTEALIQMIEAKRETGVFLSVFGFGMGNLRDEMLVKLAGKGNGNYAYIDTLREAHKAMVEQISGTLVTVAKDVKIQVEFNPAVVQSYRLLGYEKRMLAAQDFADDKKDAGEMGAGHVVTALYELVPTNGEKPMDPSDIPLRYQSKEKPEVKTAPAPAVKKAHSDEAFVVKMRHKKPDGDVSTLRELPVKDSTLPYAKASEDFRFAAAVASFSMLLRDSPYKGNASYAAVLDLASAAMSFDPSGYRAEFLEIAKQAKALSGKP